jgi:hypothetical protein
MLFINPDFRGTNPTIRRLLNGHRIAFDQRENRILSRPHPRMPALAATRRAMGRTVGRATKGAALSAAVNTGAASAAAAAKKAVDKKWIKRIERFARKLEAAWRRFDSLTDDLFEIGDDLPTEEIGPVFTAFDELRKMGVQFDPCFILKMDGVRAGIFWLNVDDDGDLSDEWTE